MDDQPGTTGPRILELRHYRIAEGRRDDFDRRFSTVALALFQKLGMRASRVWEETEDPWSLWYTVSWESAEQMRATWAAFAADPLWQSARSDVENSGDMLDGMESTVLRDQHPKHAEPGPADGLWTGKDAAEESA